MPTFLRIGKYRFCVFSNERNEPAHVHVEAGDGNAKFWLAPIQLAKSVGFGPRELSEIRRLIQGNCPLLPEK